MTTLANTTASAAATVPRGCTNFKLRQAARMVTRHYESFVGQAGLKITQYSLLSHVVSLGPLRAGELATAMQLDASSLSRNLNPLIERGLIQVRAGADARSRIVEITAAGRQLRAEVQRAWKRAQLALNERLGSERTAALHRLLDECIARLNDEQPDRQTNDD